MARRKSGRPQGAHPHGLSGTISAVIYLVAATVIFL